MEWHSLFKGIGLIGLAYILGSIPFGVLLMRLIRAEDPRQKGSGNIGATNVRRVGGNFLGVLTLIGDVGKAALPVLLTFTAYSKNSEGTVLVALVAFFAVLGHMFPLFFKGKDGGKGVATAAGGFLVISPIALITVVGLFAVVLILCRRVSVGSLAASTALPFSVFFFTRSVNYTVCASLVAILIWARHHENVKRLLAGTEPKFNKTSDS